MKRIVFVLVLSVLNFLAVAQEDQISQRKIEKLIALIDAGKCQEAYEYTKEILDNSDSYYSPYYALADCLEKSGQIEEALLIYRILILKFPHQNDPYVSAISLLQEEEKLDEQLELLKAGEESIENPSPNFYLRYAYYHLYNKDEDNLRKYLALIEPQLLDEQKLYFFMCYKARLRMFEENYSEAERLLSQAIRSRPKLSYAYSLMADVYMDTFRNDEAIAELKKLNAQKESAYNWERLGYLYDRKEDWKKALFAMDKSLALDSNVFKLSSKAYVLMKADSLDAALELFNSILEEEDFPKSSKFNFAYTLSEMGEYQRAYDIFGSLAAHNDSSRENNMGYCQMQLGNFDPAMDHFIAALEVDPNNSFVYRNLGLLMLKLDEKDKACECFNSAILLYFTEQWGSEVQENFDLHCKDWKPKEQSKD